MLLWGRTRVHGHTSVAGLVPLIVVALALGLGTTNALADDHARANHIGYDISFPQCGGAFPHGNFVIAGVDHGRPFDQNPCLAGEIASADRYALYINTGYDPTYTDARHTLDECRSKAEDEDGTTRQQAAWAVGCSEALHSMRYAASQGARHPRAWWLDVELANSWSDTDLTLNQHTLEGVVETLHDRSDEPVGVYSSQRDWKAIVGSHHVEGLDANWVATGAMDKQRAKQSCDSSLTGAHVLLVQFLGTFDTDYVCR